MSFGAVDTSLSDQISLALGAPVVVSIATEPAPMTALSWGETAHVASLATAARREEWRLGRAALKTALRAVGEAEDTAPFAFPHPRVSLTHSGTTAVAVVARAEESASPMAGSFTGSFTGIGVDLEMDRAPRLEAARFFLTQDEQEWLRATPREERRSHIVRLWTLKEAVFKADPQNATTALHEYEVLDPEALTGTAVRGPARFTYVTHRLDGGTLSVAAHHAEG